jgi:hypothetical protein
MIYVTFTEDGTPSAMFTEPRPGAEPVEPGEDWGAPDLFLAGHRRVEGAWLPRDPAPPPTPDEIAALKADRALAEAAANAAALEATIDTAIQASPDYRAFLRGALTLTAYRDAASRIEAQVRAIWPGSPV